MIKVKMFIQNERVGNNFSPTGTKDKIVYTCLNCPEKECKAKANGKCKYLDNIKKVK